MGNIYSITVSRPTRSGRGEVLVSRVVDAGKASQGSVQDWFRKQYEGFDVRADAVQVVDLETPDKSKNSKDGPAPAPELPKEEVVEYISYLSDVKVPMIDEIKDAFGRAKDARVEFLNAERSLVGTVARYYNRDEFVERVEGVNTNYDYSTISVDRIVLHRRLFEARIRKEVLPTDPDEAIKLM